MSEKNKALFMYLVAILLFFAMLIGGIVYGESRTNEVEKICLEAGNDPKDCFQ